MAHKKSIRFFNDRQVRAVWDEEHSKWWFSAIDIVRAINDEDLQEVPELLEIPEG